jgi:guanylate kinase
MAKKRTKKGALLVISGFSGVGKGTVIRHLMSTHPDYAFSVSATTRPPRPGEVHGKDYFFVDRDTFEKWVEEDKFLEYARFFEKAYGTLKDHVEDLRNQGKTVILDIEVEGARNVMKACPEAVSVYIIPPSAAELKRRIEGRGTETKEQIRARMEKALNEADIVPEYRHLVVNDEADAAAEEIHGLLNRRKKTRMPREEALELTKQIQADLRNFLQAEENCDKIN